MRKLDSEMRKIEKNHAEIESEAIKSASISASEYPSAAATASTSGLRRAIADIPAQAADATEY